MSRTPPESADGSAFDNIQTWPRYQLNTRAMNELNQWIKVENAIDNAKKYVQAKDKATDQEDKDATRLIATLCEMLETARSETSGESRRISDKPPQLFQKRVGSGNMGVIREEPHFESMIICDTSHNNGVSEGLCSQNTTAAADSYYQNTSQPPPLQGLAPGEMTNLNGGVVSQVNDLPEIHRDPAWIRAIPHITIISFAILWLVGGAWVFRILDPEIAAKSFHHALLFTFQLSATIGWGDTKATNKWSQCFCVVYTVFSVPIVFSAFANMGRLISEFYCVDWLFLTAVVRRRNFRTAQIRRRLPIKAAVNLLFVHQCIGVIIYSGLLKNFTVIATIYFSITSMATIGLGDYHPDPNSLLETIICILYMSSGIIILSALCLSIAYHFQRMHYVILKEWLHLLYLKWSKNKADKVGDLKQSTYSLDGSTYEKMAKIENGKK
ncbi:ion channel domain-containing protein [Ditylenchus destructor]|uniref:Ion channel domain-containing protein n=1 Tax=Ditylenchus destructor TaxID=166010 RepID=A0AAD4NBA6_9BILA|nr:ion channel domain-containing protein [Ditylenchus destructor]